MGDGPGCLEKGAGSVGEPKVRITSLQPSRQSVSLPHPLSKVENPGFRVGVGGPIFGTAAM